MAERLVVATRTESDSRDQEAVLVAEKLRISLTKFAGADGFAALLRRAWALAGAEVPSLKSIRVGADGRMDGWQNGTDESGSGAHDAAVAITAHFLGLLVTFIGEPLTLSLVRQAWPGTRVDEVHPRRSEAE